jgi:hypothetical protein
MWVAAVVAYGPFFGVRQDRKEITRIMSKVKVIFVAFAAVLAVSAIAASGATAASWFVGGAALPAGSKVSLATAAVVDSPAVLNSPVETVKITCAGLDGLDPLIFGSDQGSAVLKFLTCSELTPANCSVEPTLETEPVLALVKTGTGEADRVIFTPEKKTFIVVNFSGTICAIAGEKPVSGAVTVGAPTGQLELASQAIEGLGSTENNSLFLGGHPAFIEGGKALLKLATGAAWSFH